MSGRSTVYTFIGEDKFSKVADHVSRSAGGMGKKFGKAGAVMAAGVGATVTGLGVAAGLAYKFGQQASDLSETMNKSAVIFGKQAGAIDKWSANSADAMGMTKQAAVDAASTFAIVGKGAGLAGKDLTGFSTEMVGLAGDFASFHNASPEEAITAIGAALRGESEPIRRFGVMLDDATLKARAMKMGLIGTTKDALTPQTKALAAQAEIMAQSKDAQGDFARTSDGAANAQRRLSATLGDMTTQLGGAVLPVMTKVLGYVMDTGIPALRKFGEQILPKLRTAWDGIKKTVADNRPGLEKLGNLLKVVGEFVLTKVVPAFIKWEGFLARNLIKVLAKLGDILPPIVSGYLRGLAKIVGGFGNLYTAALTTLSGILTVAEKTMGWIPGIGEKITNAKTAFEGFRSNSVAKLASVETALNSAADAVDAVGTSVKALPEAKLKADITDLTAKIATAKTELKSQDLTKERKAQLKADIEDLKAKVNTAKAKLNEIQSKTVKLGINVVVAGKTIGYKAAGTTQTQSIGKVWGFAKGGYVTRPTLAVIGEAGPEAVVPMSRPGSMALPTTGPLQVNLYLDGRQIQRSLIDLQNSTGRAVIPAVA